METQNNQDANHLPDNNQDEQPDYNKNANPQQESPQKKKIVEKSQSQVSLDNQVNGNIHDNKYQSQKISPTREIQLDEKNVLVLDEITQYAMAKEGIELQDIQPKSRAFEYYLKQCNGNKKIAQLKYEFKEAERQSLLRDIENRKQIVEQNISIIGPNKFNQTFTLFKQSQMSQSHSILPSAYNTLGFKFGDIDASKNPVDNKIFENMVKNQIEQELKLKTIQERSHFYSQKEYDLYKRRKDELQRKQQFLKEKQQQRNEKLKKQEEAQQKFQEETVRRMQEKAMQTQQRQQMRKMELRKRNMEKEQQLQAKKEEVIKKQKEFDKKQKEKQDKLQQEINKKREQKDKILQTVKDAKWQEEERKMSKFQEKQMSDIDKEKRQERQKKMDLQQRQMKGQEKNQKIQFKIDEAYRKMEEWQKELEKREKRAQDNMKQQQSISQEQLILKREMKQLKNESAQLKQKRKENRIKLQKDEMVNKQQSELDRFEKFKFSKNYQVFRKQQEIFQAEQKRGDIRNALYHMAVWNVQEAGDIIQDIIQTNEKLGSVKPISVAEKVRKKASNLRRNERVMQSQMGQYQGDLLNTDEAVEEEKE